MGGHGDSLRKHGFVVVFFMLGKHRNFESFLGLRKHGSHATSFALPVGERPLTPPRKHGFVASQNIGKVKGFLRPPNPLKSLRFV